MTHAPPAARTPRPTAEYRWTPRKAHAFIEALAQHGKVAAAARAVGMTRQSAYRLRDRVPQVADIWSRAQAVGSARRRGKATLRESQDDGFHRQGDGSGPQGDGFAAQGDGFGKFSAEHCHTRQHQVGLLRSADWLSAFAAVTRGA